MSTQTLRGLARAHADGLIDRRTFIVERRQLIDGIVDGEIELVRYVPPPPPEVPPPAQDGDDTQEVHPEEVTVVGGLGTRRLGLIISAVVLSALLAAAWWFFGTAPPDAPEPVMTTDPLPRAEPANAGIVLLESFLEHNAWNADDTDALAAAWFALSPAARSAADERGVVHRFGDAVYNRIVEENALIELGEEVEARETQARLFQLADTLGIRNNAVQRLHADWEDAQTAHRAAAAGAHDLAEPTQQPLAADARQNMTIPSEEPTVSNPALSPAPPGADEPAADPEPSTTGGADETPLATIETPSAGEATTEPAEPDVADPAISEVMTAPAATPAPQSPVAEPAIAEPTVATPIPAPAAEPVSGPAPAIAPAVTSKGRKRGACRAGLAGTRKPYCRDRLADDLAGPMLVVVPAGRFEMGGDKPNERPRHDVQIAKPFAVGMYEVSVAELTTFCNATGTSCPQQPWADPAYPAVNVSWAVAVAYTEWLSSTSGARYRLPSESEWEYVTRAGTNTAYPFGDEILPTHARFSFMRAETEPVAANDRSINRNAFRLYHTLGNVREWVLDGWTDDYAGSPADGTARPGNAGSAHVARGGSYADGTDTLRSAARAKMAADSADERTGFRVVRAVD